MLTPEMAGRRGLVPGRPFGRVILEWLVAQRVDPEDLKDGISIAPWDWLSAEMKMDPSNLRKIRDGKRSWIGFDVADRIVTVIDPFLWRTDPELSRIYQSVNFTWLDRKKPCAVAA